jgi:hypothetical protein
VLLRQSCLTIIWQRTNHLHTSAAGVQTTVAEATGELGLEEACAKALSSSGCLEAGPIAARHG